MTKDIQYLEALARETKKSEAEVVAMAFQAGLRHLWRERTLARYLRGEITRSEAIESAGLDWVEFAERQKQAVLEDMAWAFREETQQ